MRHAPDRRAPQDTPPTFALKAVTQRFGRITALAEVTLALEAGQRVALLGPSGGGKSTLMRLLSGALRPTTGRVLVDGQDLSARSRRGLRRHRARCGLVAQGSLLVPQLSVHENVVAGRLPVWSWPKIALSVLWPLERARTRALLDQVGLAERQWDPTHVLSGGQQQRVAIARALANEPAVILADEPTSALDPTTAAEVVALLLDRTTQRGASLVMCTHWASLVLPSVDRVVGIREGRVVLDAAASAVSKRDLDVLYAGTRERR